MIDLFSAITTNFNPVNDGIVLIIFLGSIIVYSRSRIPQQTIKNLQDLSDSQILRINQQEASIAELKEGRVEDAKTIGKLQGQIESYKELPLQELANGIKEVAVSNKKILDTLQTTARINAEDRDVLTNQNKHIASEVDKRMDEKR